MPDQNTPESQSSTQPQDRSSAETGESFGALLSEYEQSHRRKTEEGHSRLEGTIVTVTADSVLLDIGFKTEGILPLNAFQAIGEIPRPGDKIPVSIKGRDPEGYYELTRFKVERPKDWSALEKAFVDKTAIAGTVIGVVKGGMSVDIGVRAFMPASRSGVRDAAEMEKLVGQDVRCRIIKLDVADEDVVVDARAVAEEEQRASRDRRFSELKEGEIVRGVVRNIMEYGAFVDVGGADALLHIGDIAWGRVNNVADVLSPGQEIEAQVLKIDSDRRRLSIGMKQILPHPWDSAAEKYKVGERVRGTVTRVVEFGAFVELEPGVEGLIHLSEMSWTRKVKRTSDAVKPGEAVEAVVLGVNVAERRISLGLKQALGDPWSDIGQKFPVGSIVEGPIVSITRFGVFVQLSNGIEGMIHVSDISAEKRINHPQDVFKAGQIVKAQVLEIDSEKRRLRLGIKQMVPSSLEEYMAEHKEGDVVTGRIVEVSNSQAQVELGEGVRALCRFVSNAKSEEQTTGTAKADLSSLTSMLSARWKGAAGTASPKKEPARTGQIASFRITSLKPAEKKIELEQV